MITYCVDVYRSRPIGESLLTTSPRQGCLALYGLHTGLAGRGDGYPLNTDLSSLIMKYHDNFVVPSCHHGRVHPVHLINAH